jgi:hypothetical protein
MSLTSFVVTDAIESDVAKNIICCFVLALRKLIERPEGNFAVNLFLIYAP